MGVQEILLRIKGDSKNGNDIFYHIFK